MLCWCEAVLGNGRMTVPPSPSEHNFWVLYSSLSRSLTQLDGGVYGSAPPCLVGMVRTVLSNFFRFGARRAGGIPTSLQDIFQACRAWTMATYQHVIENDFLIRLLGVDIAKWVTGHDHGDGDGDDDDDDDSYTSTGMDEAADCGHT